ncbi:MAG: DUF4974 domain-containing protein [Gammaproteobacteria bacterium]|nr:MAG: DUF4974 domain-containing protein [Gammaproteobacteria bacterium]
MKESHLNRLFTRFLNNQCSPEEVRLLLLHFNAENNAELRRLIREEIEKEETSFSQPDLHKHTSAVWQQIRQKIGAEEDAIQLKPIDHNTTRRIIPWFRIAAAACIFLVFCLGTYLLKNEKKDLVSNSVDVLIVVKDTLAPGSDKAVLTLSNGRKINLDNSQSGLLATEGAARIKKTDNGRVIYESSSDVAQSTEISYNTLSTPRGGKYDLTLSDGTKVWLNAASSIRYPSVFSGTSREVEITGEAYLEVQHDASRPFRVIAAGQLIEDIGTAFNVNTYDDEPVLKTTLIEGSIKITSKSQAAILKPGEQALMSNNGQTFQVKRDVDVEEAIAWHRGFFSFYDADIKTVMRQLARWYDVDISYEGAVPQRRFSGKIYRNISALKVADLLSYKQIHFRIEGRRIVVMP